MLLVDSGLLLKEKVVKVRVTVSDSGLCCCICVTYFER